MRIDNIKNKKVLLNALLKYLGGILVLDLVITGVALYTSKCHTSVVSLIIEYNFVIVFGLCGSMIIHELAHYILMRLYKVKQIGIDTTLFRFSVFTNEEMCGKKLLLVSIAGVVSTTLVGSMLLGINMIFNNYIIRVIMWIYYIHLINILPLFGDGKMLLKALITMKVKDA
jgi:hypothetical protein